MARKPIHNLATLLDALSRCSSVPLSEGIFLRTDVLYRMQQTSIIIPCYNEDERLCTESFQEISHLCEKTRLWFVNDGSSDNTQEVINRMAKAITPKPGLINIPANVGKAEAVRRGILTSLKEDGCSRCGFWDADLATPLSELPRMSRAMDENPGLVMVSECRVQRLGAAIIRNSWRHYQGRVFATTAAIVLGIPVYDTQCGAKLFRSDVAAEIFSKPFISRWSFDVELFARLGHHRNKESVLELPLLKWIDYPGSKLNLSGAFRAALDIFRIYVRYR